MTIVEIASQTDYQAAWLWEVSRKIGIRDYQMSQEQVDRLLEVARATRDRRLGINSGFVADLSVKPVEPRRRDSLSKDSVVYFFLSTETCRVKIGYAENLDRRHRSISTGAGMELKIALVIRGGRDKEKAYHHRFKQYRLKGEWFRYEGKLKTFIDDSSFGGASPNRVRDKAQDDTTGPAPDTEGKE